MKRLSLQEAIDGLKEVDYEVEDLGRGEIYRYVVQTADHEFKYFENGRKLVSWAKSILQETKAVVTEQDSVMDMLISRYYTSTEMEEKGNLFFTIDQYLRDNRSKLSERMVRIATNIIVLG